MLISTIGLHIICKSHFLRYSLTDWILTFFFFFVSINKCLAAILMISLFFNCSKFYAAYTAKHFQVMTKLFMFKTNTGRDHCVIKKLVLSLIACTTYASKKRRLKNLNEWKNICRYLSTYWKSSKGLFCYHWCTKNLMILHPEALGTCSKFLIHLLPKLGCLNCVTWAEKESENRLGVINGRVQSDTRMVLAANKKDCAWIKNPSL